jgi:hypothetical protein
VFNTLMGRFGGFAGSGTRQIDITMAPPAVSTPTIVDFNTVSLYRFTANTAGTNDAPGQWTFSVLGSDIAVSLEAVGGGGAGGFGSSGPPAQLQQGVPGANTTITGPGSLSVSAGGGGAGRGGSRYGPYGPPPNNGGSGAGGIASGGNTNTDGNAGAGGNQGGNPSPTGFPGQAGATVAPAYFTPLGQSGSGSGGRGGGPDNQGGSQGPGGGGGGGGSAAYVLKTHTLIGGQTYNIVVGGKGIQPAAGAPNYSAGSPDVPATNQPGGAKITIT